MSQKWTKVKNLKVGSQIAVYDNGVLAWDEVASIKSVSRERVYDIEVENSHNFVGNGILAHNTYIFGNLEVAGDIAGQAFINISTAAAKKDINFLTDADYANILGKIASTSVASYYYNSDTECGGDSSSPQMRGGIEGGELNFETPPPPTPSSTEEGGNNSVCQKRLGLIAEQAPREILSVDGKGVDLYKMTSFLWAGVKAQQKKIDEIADEVAKIKERISMSLGAGGEIPVSSTGGQTIQSPALMAAVADVFNQLGVKFDQGVMKVRNLAVDFLQVRKLAVDVTPDDANNPSGLHRDPTIGSGQINPGETAIYIVNNQVSTSSKIFITAERPVALGLCLKNQATSPVDGLIQPPGFKVCLAEPAGETIKFDWWIVEAMDNSQQATSPQPSPYQGEGVVNPSAQPSPLQGEGAGEVSPSPEPSALPSPSPSVSPEPEPTPSIEPTPSAEPTSPQPSPYQGEGVVNPSAQPSPLQGEGAGEVSPSPEPSPAGPEPSASPEASPLPSETPAPSETPMP